MSGDNPFDDNPFNNSTNAHGSVQPVSGGWDTSAAGAWGGGGSSSYTPAVVQTVGSSKELSSKEADLARREAQLNQREAEMRRMEVELRNNGGSKSNKNWPRFCPIVRHDIAGEIPAEKRGMVRCAYWAFLGLILCMFVNLIGTVAVLIGVGGDNLSSFLWAAIWALGGVPGAFLAWYMRLYNGAIKDSAISYAIFFLAFLAHLGFVAWSAVAPPILKSWSHTGFMSAIDVIGDNTGAGVIYFIGAGLWSVEFLWSFWTLKVVYSQFRGRKAPAAAVPQV